MPKIKPRTKLPKGQQLSQPLQGELATYEQVGLFQHSVGKKTAYRYRGILKQYQKALNGATPTLEASTQLLAHLRKQGFSLASLRLYRAALQGFHAWRSEQLTFAIRVPHHLPEYIQPSIVTRMLELSQDKPKGEMIADGWKFFTPTPDIEDIIDARATPNTLPERMVKASIIRGEGGKLNNADKLYLYRQRHRQSKWNWSDAEKIERMRQLYVDDGLTCAEAAKIVGKGRSTVQRRLKKLGVIRR